MIIIFFKLIINKYGRKIVKCLYVIPDCLLQCTFKSRRSCNYVVFFLSIHCFFVSSPLCAYIVDKSEDDVERESQLLECRLTLTEERNAVLVPSPGSGIPGAPAETCVLEKSRIITQIIKF